jgi:outer membrane protein
MIRMCATSFAAFALLLLPAGQASAQVPGDTLRLTLDAAVARGVQQAEEVDLARAQRQVAEGQVVQARAGAFPQVSGQVTYNRTLASIFDGISLAPEPEEGEEPGENPFASLPFGRPNVWSAGIQVTQPLYAAGRIGTGLNIAREVRRAADAQVAEAEADIALQVRSAYFQTVLADAFIGISQEAVQLATEHLRQVELFRQQGTASEFDVLRARVERDNLEPQVIEAVNARRLAELNLRRLTNIPPAQPIVLVTPLDARIADVDRAALEVAVRRRPALQSAAAVVAAREGAVRIAQADRMPSVGAAANFNYQAFPSTVTPFDTDWRRDWTVAVQMNVPIFTGFRTSGQIQQARAELWQAQLQMAQLEQGIDIELEAALGEVDAARAQIEARRATVEQARRTLELAELRYRSGLATQLDISNARLLLEQSRVNEAQSLFNYLNALARLERVTGNEVPLLAPRIPTEG